MPLSQTPSPMSPEHVTSLAQRALKANVTQLQMLRPGGWSTVYAFCANGRDYVIRFSMVAEDFERDSYAARFASPYLPIPKVVALDAYNDMYYAISERLPGTFLDDLDSEGMDRLLPSLLEALTGMRAVDTSRTSGYGNWDATGNAPYRTWHEFLLSVENDDPGERGSGWRDKLASSTTGTVPYEECLARMTELFDRIPEARHVVHSDLLNYNVLVQDGEISGIIDWGCGFYGDHLYDVAWFAFWAPWYPQWRDLDLVHRMMSHLEDQGADMTQADNRLRCYMLHIGLGQMRYSAFIEHWDQLHLEARRALSIARNTYFDLNETE